MDEMVSRAGSSVLVRSPEADRLAAAIRGSGGTVTLLDDGALSVVGFNASSVGELASRERVVLHELSPQQASLEEAFMALTKDDVEFGGSL
jgi:ABC-2 type transport system ATP-binding protein